MKKKLSIILSLVIIIGITLYFLFIRDKPIDDADLRLELPNIPKEDNAFHLLVSLDRKVFWPSGADKEIADKMVEGGELDSKLCAEIISKNTSVMETINKAVSCKHLQYEGRMSVGTLLPYFGSWKHAGSLLCIRARDFLSQNKEKEALDEVMKAIKLGYMTQKSKSCFMFLIRGCQIKIGGYATIKKILSSENLTSELLKPYIKELSEYAAREQDIIEEFKMEYVAICNGIDDMKSKRFPIEFEYTLPYRENPKRFWKRLTLKPSRIKEVLAEIYRAEIAYIQRMPKVKVNIYDLPVLKEERTTAIRQHSVAELFISSTLSTFEKIDDLLNKESTQHSITVILIALKCYKLDHGDLPETLDALVPEYLDKVPIDDFSGEPMKYSKKNKIVYSVGPDMKDSGGKKEIKEGASFGDEDYWFHDDEGYKIEF